VDSLSTSCLICMPASLHTRRARPWFGTWSRLYLANGPVLASPSPTELMPSQSRPSTTRLLNGSGWVGTRRPALRPMHGPTFCYMGCVVSPMGLSCRAGPTPRTFFCHLLAVKKQIITISCSSKRVGCVRRLRHLLRSWPLDRAPPRIPPSDRAPSLDRGERPSCGDGEGGN
jgi:hypothetical protein